MPCEMTIRRIIVPCTYLLTLPEYVLEFFTLFTVRPYRLASLLGIGVLTTGCGISATYNYPGTGLTHDLNEREVQILGEISTCHGAGCNDESSLSLTIAPPASNYQAALRKKAAQLYSVPESQVVLGEITVRFSCNELLGTIRGWQAQAIAGKKTLSEDGMSTSRPAHGQTNTH